MKSLFLVMSKALRGPDYLNVQGQAIWGAALGDARVVVLPEPARGVTSGWPAIRAEILGSIQSSCPKVIRIAGHHVPSFGGDIGDLSQKRLNEREAEIKDDPAYQMLGGTSDLQVFGFHTVNESPIWTALRQLKGAVDDPAIASGFVSSLHCAFDDTVAQRRSLDVLKHRLMRLFLGLDLEVQALHDKQHGVHGLQASEVPKLVSRFDDKVREARELLDAWQDPLDREGLDQVRETLNSWVLLDDLHIWVVKLGERLNALRGAQ